MKRFLSAALVLAPLLLAAPAGARDVRKGDIVLEQPRIRASLGRAPNTAAYLMVRNTGRTPDRLLGASCACARKVEIHHHDMSGGVMRMRALPALPAPARGVLSVEPAGPYALMVMGLKAPLRAGGTVEMRLRFERAGEIRTPFAVTQDVAAPSH
jgi:copper(I)-binding protein